jgi:diguanylate cyclase (GGDEF)-like protein
MSKTNVLRNTGTSPFRRFFALQYLPAIIAIIAMIGILVYADWLNQNGAIDSKRNAVAEQIGLIRTKLEGNINGNIQLVRGLVGALEVDPDMDQGAFTRLASNVLEGTSQFRNVAIAPNFVVTMVYPYGENQKVLGLDYMKNDKQRAAALEVKNTGKPVVTGPVKLVQGGDGLIARFPIYARAAYGQTQFTGIASAVMDLNTLYRDSGLLSSQLPVDVALSVIDGAGTPTRTFFGEPSVLQSDPVLATIKIGHENWQLAAMPKAGWDLSLYEIWRFRLLLLFGEFIIVLPMLWAGRLIEERQRNVHKLALREDEMKALSHRLEIALETSKIGVWDFNVTTDQLIWDERMRVLYDVPPARAMVGYEDWRSVIHPDDLSQAQREFAQAIDTESNYRSEFRVVWRDGTIHNIRAIGTAYRDIRGNQKIVGVNWDVTEDFQLQAELRSAKRQSDEQNKELERARVRMESAALHDALTGLPNRRYLDQIMLEADGTHSGATDITVLHIDLDRFKDINDTLGHAAGDLILRHAATTLRQNIRDDDFLARIGGDEFVVVSRNEAKGDYFSDMAARLIEAISKPVDYQGHECRVGASIGIASRLDENERIEQMLVNADIALYEAKRRGRNRVERFSDTLRLVAVNTKRTADEILRGLEQNEFVAYFQPQFDAHTLEIVGIEALARWDHPTKGILGPDSFLSIAESLKVVAAIDDIILNQALLQHYRLTANGIDIPKVSVNVSAQRLRDETLIDRIKATNFRPGTLSFELLESISLDGHDGELIPQIEKIRALGIEIDIDDFGTGYASIVTLLKLTPRRLKIDRQLILPIVDSPAQQQLVSSIIDIGRSRGIEIVAEGVETMAHAAILRDLGCHVLQGYALSRPLSPAALLTFAKERRWLEGQIVAKAS